MGSKDSENSVGKGVVLVTGASAGIGWECAKIFHEKGYSVVALARRKDRLDELAALLNLHRAGSFLSIPCDVRNRGELDQAVQQALEHYGQLDIVFANAGYGVAGKFERLTVEDFRRQFETNVFGVLETVYATLKPIQESKGIIALMGSANSYVSEAKKAPYCMSKFAVRALAESLYWELRLQGVHVSLICPGIVESEIRKVDNKGAFHENVQDVAPKWLTMPTELAAKKICAGILSRKKEIYITFHGKVAIYANRYLPALLYPILKQGKSVSRQ